MSDSCLNCGAVRPERYCGACGQDGRHHRLETRTLLRDWADGFLNFDGTFWTTFRGLTRGTGQMASDYVSGRRRPYTHPLRYLLVAAAFYALLLLAMGKEPTDLSQDIYGEGSLAAESLEKYREGFNQAFRWVFLTAIPAIALGLRAFFAVVLAWRPRAAWNWNFAECFMLSAYIHAHATLVITPFGFFLQERLGAAFLWVMLPSAACYLWAVQRFFRCSWWLALAAYLGAYLLWIVGLAFASLTVSIAAAVVQKLLGG